MTTTTIHRVRCDVHGCTAGYRYSPASAAAKTRTAAAAGWTRTQLPTAKPRYVDRCPAHADTRTREESS